MKFYSTIIMMLILGLPSFSYGGDSTHKLYNRAAKRSLSSVKTIVKLPAAHEKSCSSGKCNIQKQSVRLR